MTLAIMQPYFFPYLGYFQLLAVAQTFVFLDDVNYQKGGWINRNRINRDGEECWFSIPVRKASHRRKISDTLASGDTKWRKNLLRQLEYAYRDAPFRSEGLDLVQRVFDFETEHIGELAKRSVVEVLKRLNCNVNLVWTSTIFKNDHLTGQDRVIDICKCNAAATYINASGGRSLYDERAFFEQGINLEFVQPVTKSSCRLKGNTLSIIDALMNHSADEVASALTGFKK